MAHRPDALSLVASKHLFAAISMMNDVVREARLMTVWLRHWISYLGSYRELIVQYAKAVHSLSCLSYITNATILHICAFYVAEILLHV